MFAVGDKVVYPMHGAGIIEGIEEKEVLGTKQVYYIMKLPIGELSVMIPTCGTTEVGLRYVVDAVTANRVLQGMKDAEIPCASNWNKRYRENMLRLKNGDIVEVAAVVKSLMLRERERGLSTGERKMLVSARQILISEIVLASNKGRDDMEARLEEAVFGEE